MRKVFRAVMIVACLLGIIFSTLSYYAYHQYYSYLEARRNMRSLERDFTRLESRLTRAVRVYPLPLFWLELGKVFLWRAMAEVEFGEPPGSLPFLDQARQALVKAIEGQPVDYEAFWELSKVYFLYNYPAPVYADKARKLCQEAVRRHPYDEFINLNVLMVFFEQWDLLGEAEKTWVKDRIKLLSSEEASFLDRLKARWRAYHHETRTLELRFQELGL